MGTHLSHKLPWNSLKCLHFVRDDPGILLSTGKCEKIHIVDRKTEQSLKTREYLANKVCSIADCKVTGTKLFFKRESGKYKLSSPGNRGRREPLRDSVTKSQVTYFHQCFQKAVKEFADTERKKVSTRLVKMVELKAEDTNQILNETMKRLNEMGKPIVADPSKINFFSSCNCYLVTLLIQAKDLETLLKFPTEEIRKVFHCLHGSQLIGNNISFLTWHITMVYFVTNMIISCGFENDKNLWGKMTPGTFHFNELGQDCDGHTFLETSRRFITEELYILDQNSTKQLLKDCFEYFYYIWILQEEINELEIDVVDIYTNSIA